MKRIDPWHAVAKDWMAFDPPVSEKQRRAMYAAAEGKSNLGIPKEVGKEFVGKDEEPHLAAGVMFVSPEGKILLLKRSEAEENYAGYWSLPGGGADGDETPEQAAIRECREEIGREPLKLEVFDEKTTPTGIEFTTFLCDAAEEFEPVLNGEHSEYGWFDMADLPENTHPAVKELITGKAQDCIVAKDAALAFDRSSLRAYDADGRLKVAPVPISKANICPYYGREIPGYESLGLDPERVYHLYRDPDELAKAASTFDNVPLLSEHVPVSAKDPQKELVIGSTGNGAKFVYPYLMNSLVIWDDEAIKRVESNDQKEISSAYRYRADMTPVVIDGVKADGVMRDIVGNHVAIVREGRAGKDVVIGDSKEQTMKKTPLLSRKAALMQGATLAFLSPKLAADAKINLTPAFAGVNASNAKAKRSEILKAVEKAVSGKLAKDSNVEGLATLLEALEEEKVEEETLIPEKEDISEDADPIAALKEWLAGKLSDEDMIKLNELVSAIGEAGKAHEEEEMKALDEEEEDMPEKEKKDGITKAAMDSAISTAVAAERKRAKDIRAAEEAVRPYVGSLVAMDSAADIYRAALNQLGIKTDGIHESAFPALLEMQPKPGARRVIAQDSVSSSDLEKRFPELSRIGQA